MIRKFKLLIEQRLSLLGEEPASTGHTLELAAAALLLEVARADHDAHPAEEQAVIEAIRAAYPLSEEEVASLLAAAGDQVEDAVSLHEFTRVLNDRLDETQKQILLEDLWRVARADGHLDKYEEYMIRKIADLLYVSHRDFIRAKHRVMS